MKCVMETEHKLFLLNIFEFILKKAPTIYIVGAFF